MSSVIRGSDNFDSLAHQGIGVNQTWQDVTGSRSPSTTYINTTGKPIVFYYSGRSSGTTGQATMIIDGVSLPAPSWASSVASAGQLIYVIPNGSTYSYTQGGYVNAVKIAELR